MMEGEKRKAGRPPKPADQQKVRYVIRLHKELRAWAEQQAEQAKLPVSAWVAALIEGQADSMVQSGDLILPDSYLDLDRNGHIKGEFARAGKQMTVYLSQEAARSVEQILHANGYAPNRQPKVIARVVAAYYLGCATDPQ